MDYIIIIDDNYAVSKEIKEVVEQVFDDCLDKYDFQIPKDFAEYKKLKDNLYVKKINRETLIIIDYDLKKYENKLNYTDFIKHIKNLKENLNKVKPILIIISYNFTSGVFDYINDFDINVFPKKEENIDHRTKKIFEKFLFKIRRNMGLFPLTMLPNYNLQSISIKDKKSFLSLFSYEDQYFEIGKLSNKLLFIPTIEEKVYREIDNAILSSKGTNKSTIRTITMLLGLKKYFKSNTNKEIISELENESKIELTDNKKKWKLSYPLLVVKAVQFSQLEWENQEYCFEHFSGIRAQDEIEKLLNLFFNNNNKDNIKNISKIFYSLIRWQTIYGQIKRESAELSIEHIISYTIIKQYKEIFNKMLIAVSYADEFLKKDKSINEKEIGYIVRKGNINKLFENNFLKELILPKKIEKDLLNNNNNNNNNNNKGFIWSHLRVVYDTKSENFENLKQCLKDKENEENEKNKKLEENEYKAKHFILNKKQRYLGILHNIECIECKKEKNNCDVYNKFSLMEKNKEKSDKIKTVLITIEPSFVAEKLYLNSKKVTCVDIESPIEFLKYAFNIILINSRGKLDINKRITLPMVKRITDLLEFYPEYNNNNNEDEDEDEVLKVKILFDKGKDKIEIWLPKNINEIENCTIDYNKLTLADILLRYLQFVVLNYGMTKGFYHVDYDFSQLNDKEVENKWKEYLTLESSEIESTYKKLGAHVFYRYLTDCGSEIIDTTFSRQKYLAALTPRKMTEIYKFDKSDITEKIKDKYIMGIDIGATGVKIGFYKIIKHNNNNYNNNCYKLCNIKNKNIEDEFDLERCPDLDFIMPILSPEVKKKDKDKYYENAEEFAKYVIETMLNKAGNMHDILNKTICIGLCWPGPIKQNRIASTSSILKNFKSFSNRILENDHNKIINFDISKAFKKVIIDRSKIDNDLKVSLTNDGDAEAAGSVFGITNKQNINKNENENIKSLFNDHSVAVIKMGTGTAGSVIVNGKIIGLNEFGKLIVDLGFDNKDNIDKKDENERFPKGDSNKFFSFNFIYNQMKAVFDIINDNNNNNVHDEKSIKVITGHDLALLLEIKTETDETDKTVTDETYKLFGALELISLTEPYLEWKSLVNEKNSIKDNISLRFEDNNFTISEGNIIDDRAYCELYDRMKKSNYDNKEIEQILFENNNKSLNKSLLKSLNELLLTLGKHRFEKRLKIDQSKLKDYQDNIRIVCKNLGEHLADVVALLYDIYNLKAVIIAGGIIKNKVIGDLCKEGFQDAIEKYIHDNFHTKKNNNLVKKIEDIKNKDDIVKNKLLFHIQKSNEALLGTAMLGFDHFITENKIKELQQIAKMTDGKVADKCTFLTKDEAKNFMKVNAGYYRITIDDEGEISTLK